MLKKFFFATACCGLLLAPSRGAIEQVTYYECKGFESNWFAYGESDGKMLTLALDNRPTGWKVGRVYRARNGNDSMYFDSESNLEFAMSRGYVKDATDKATISETTVQCAVDSTHPIPVIFYEPYQYTIAFNANASSASGTMEPQARLSYTNTTTTLRPNAFRRTGYVFKGWTKSVAGTGTVFADKETVGGEKFGVTQDGQTVTLYAQWTANSYKVAYDEAGGTAGSSRPTSATYGTAFQVSAPTRTGYTFQGWTVSGHDANAARYGTTSTSVATSLPANGQITAPGDVWLKNLTPTAGATVKLTARWQVITCRVTFSAEGGRNGTETRDINYGQETSGFATITPPERANYTFGGYYTKTGGLGIHYFDADGRLLKTWDIAATACTLYAYWTATDYIVTFDSNGGSGTVADQHVTYTKTFTLPSGSGLTPPSDGQSFGGWALSAHANAADYRVGQQTSLQANSQYLSGGKLTFYAYWQDNTRTIAVKANGGTASSNNFTVVIGKRYDARGPLPTASWTDGKKLFAGWYTATSDGTRVQASDTVPQEVPKTLYAHWTNAAYVVHFDGNGSTDGTMADQTIFFGTSTALTPNAFARTGYTFAGWAQTNAPTRVSFADEESVTDLATRAGEVVNLLAVWTTNTYYVAFDANGGEGTMPTLTNFYDRSFTLPANRFTRSGFWGFSEWRDVATGQTYAEGAEALNLTNAPFATVTLQAVWTNSLSKLSQAMHCYNLDWQDESLGTNSWQVLEGPGVGHGTDSCVRQSNGAPASQKMLWTELKPKADKSGMAGKVAGTLSFWWKPTGAAAELRGGWRRNLNGVPGDPQLSLTASTDTWTNVTVRIEADDSNPLFLGLLNMTPSGEGFCCIDGMTWTPDGESPTPGESDRVEVSSLTQTANGLELSFTGDARFAYHVRATDSLSPTQWYDFGPTNVGRGAAQSFVIPFDTAAPQRFFKIQTIQKPTP